MSFIPGISLSERFYWEAVRPSLDARFAGLPHAAALVGDGSEVLGFDDAMSTDHHWGPRVILFLRDVDHPLYAEAIREALRYDLPHEFLGYPTSFTEPDPADHGVQLLRRVNSGPINHRVAIETVRSFLTSQLGYDLQQPLEPADWLTFSEQRLRTVVAGAVFHDDLGLQAVRNQFTYYPRDVWLYLLAAGWTRLGQEEHLMGRAGLAGDEVGSALIGARLARDAMRLGFLMEREYAPYPKWFGTAFQRLRCAGQMEPHLRDALRAESWQAREAHLVAVGEQLAAMHNALQLTEPLPQEATSFFGRPFRVVALHGFAQALLRQVRDPAVARIAARPLIGSLDQFSDSVDLVANPVWRSRLRPLYD